MISKGGSRLLRIFKQIIFSHRNLFTNKAISFSSLASARKGCISSMRSIASHHAIGVDIIIAQEVYSLAADDIQRRFPAFDDIPTKVG